MRAAITILILFAIPGIASAKPAERIAQLEKRIEKLESVVNSLRRHIDSMGPMAAPSEADEKLYRRRFEEGRVRSYPSPNDKWREEEIRKIMRPRVGDRGPDGKYLKGFEYPYPKPCKENNWLGFGSEEAYNKAADDFVY